MSHSTAERTGSPAWVAPRTDRRLVGRDVELSRAREITSAHEVPRMLYVWGPPGVGKTALLRQLARDLEGAGAGRRFVALDGIHRTPGTDSLLPKVAGVTAEGEVDIVLATGRHEPPSRWEIDAPFDVTPRSVLLGPLSTGHSESLLDALSVAHTDVRTIVPLAHGNPLFLTLAASFARTHPGVFAEAAMPTALACRFLELTLDEVDSPERRAALESCAVAGRVDQHVLSLALKQPECFDAFEWLRRCSVVESTRLGLAVQEPFRAAILAELRWRDPDGAGRIVSRVRRLYAGRLRRNRAGDAERWVHSYAHLAPTHPRTCPGPEPEVHATTAGDLASAFPAIAARAAMYALGVAQPGGGIRAAAIIERVGPGWSPATSDPWSDPIVGLLREGCVLGPGEVATIVQIFGPAFDAALRRALLTAVTLRLMRDPAVVVTFVVARDDARWASYLERVASPLGGEPGIGSTHVFDWRRQSFVALLDAIAEPDPVAGSDPPERGVTTRLDRRRFDAAVRDALRLFHNDAGLSDSLLLRTDLVPPLGRAEDRVESLRRRIVLASRGLGPTGSAEKLHRILDRTYFEPAGTQERAADALGLPFGTYRRHLRSAIGELSATLWRALRSSGT